MIRVKKLRFDTINEHRSKMSIDMKKSPISVSFHVSILNNNIRAWIYLEPMPPCKIEYYDMCVSNTPNNVKNFEYLKSLCH
jgi:hypothetical protein